MMKRWLSTVWIIQGFLRLALDNAEFLRWSTLLPVTYTFIISQWVKSEGSRWMHSRYRLQ